MSETCPYCGLELPDPQVFICPHCNHPLNTTPPLDPEEITLPRLRVTRVSHPLSVHDMQAGQTEPEVLEADPQQTEPGATTPVIPEPVIPEPAMRESLMLEPMISEPAVPEPVIPEAEPEPVIPEAEQLEKESAATTSGIPEAEQTEPTATTPMISEPMISGPMISEPMTPEPAMPAPMIPEIPEPELPAPELPEQEQAEPVVLEAERQETEPTVMAPVILEPVILEPVMPEPMISAPAMLEPMISEPVIPESVIPEPFQLGVERQEMESAANGPHVWEAERQETVPAVYPDLPTYVPQPSPLLPLPPDRRPSHSVLPRPLVPPLAPPVPPAAPIHPVANRHRTGRILVGILLLAVIVGGAGALYAVSHNPVIYQSSLKGSLDNWEVGPDCAPKSDGYHIRSGAICYAPIGSQANADITVHVVQLRGSTELFYGIVLRSAPRQHYYLFGIDGNGKWAFVNVPGTTRLPVSVVAPTLDSAIHNGIHQVNTLEVKMKGTHFDFFINGAKVGEINDSHYATGQIGLSGEDGVEVVYTDLSIVKVN